METMRDIKRRISSVQNTQKITRAMKMVAASKLRKAQEKAERARPFFNKTKKILSDVAHYTREIDEHPLIIEREGDRILYIVITADRGLCGPYNSRIIKRAEQELQAQEEAKLLAIGQKGRNYFHRRDVEIISEYLQLEDYPDFTFSRRITEEVISLYKEEVVDKVRLIYTHFDSPLSQTVVNMSLLPVEKPEEEEGEARVDYLYEPEPHQVLDVLLPQYINNLLYSAQLEAKASEFGSRMTAMDAATDNAEEMIEELTLSYNRARQAEITKEITEIVSGAEALK